MTNLKILFFTTEKKEKEIVYLKSKSSKILKDREGKMRTIKLVDEVSDHLKECKETGRRGVSDLSL